MSLFSRFFRKAPPPSPAPEASPEPDTVRPEQSVPDRALMAAREEETLKAAIDGHDAQTVARLVVGGTSTKVRQLAAQAIEDPIQLRQLIKAVRGGNDKSVYKILARKRDVLLTQARELEQLQAEIGAVSTALERHSHRPYDPLFTPTLEQLQNRWKALAADADPEILQKVQHAIDRSREVIAQHIRQIEVEASRELAAANAAVEAQRLRDLEKEAAAIAAAERARILEADRKAQAERREAEALAFRQIGGWIRKAHGALHEGSTGRAAGLRRVIEEKLPGAPPLPPHLANQLQQLDAKLNELKDWKSFSVTPKRVELLEEMESLVGSTLDPATLAARIKSLREEWRTLSKGAGESLEADWQRFQEAAQKAYQPCHEYFEAQALVRQENLQRRRALLERLAAFEAQQNWEQPDWRTLITALRESKQEWRRHSPVDRAGGKALQERFDVLMASLQSRLDAEYARNVTEKKSLIERAQRLLASEDSRKAIDAVKELQQKWQAVGLVPRDADQQLWKEFRQHCDAAFEKRQQDFTDYTAGLEANRSKAVTLCEELEKIVVLSGPELLENAKQLPDLRVAFEAIGEFPRGGARELRARFERALERCDRAVAQQQARDAERSWTDLLDAADLVRAYRLAIARNADVAERDVLRRAAENYIAAVGGLPKGGLEAIKSELAREDGRDLTANETALRTLCIRAEILSDIPTPPEDQGLRRAYQVQRLIQNMGQGITADEAQLDTMVIEWIGVGPTEDATYTPLLERFKRCRQHRLTSGVRVQHDVRSAARR
ncbi:MAG: hypothetical protein JWM63_5651 [Gammaproteobacteria bacterium]|jgi:hypothetical protein|nr:hypothetical protein [Gammaproteobacteria bacterium]